jgi:hypothetical protein
MALTACLIQMIAYWIIITFKIVSSDVSEESLCVPKGPFVTLIFSLRILISCYRSTSPLSLHPCILHTRTSPSHSGQRDWVTVISNPRYPPNKIFPAKIYFHLDQKYSKWFNRVWALSREQVSVSANKIMLCSNYKDPQSQSSNMLRTQKKGLRLAIRVKVTVWLVGWLVGSFVD